METLLHVLMLSFVLLMAIAIVVGLADIRRALRRADVLSAPATPLPLWRCGGVDVAA